MSRGTLCWTSNLHRIFSDFYSQLGPPDPWKSLFFLQKNNVFLKNGLLKLTLILGRLWRPTCLPNRPKIHQNPENIDSQNPSKFWSFFALIFYRFWLRFGSQVGAMLATKTAPRRPQDAPGGLPGGALRGVFTSKGPKTILVDFWSYRLLIVFSSIFHWFPKNLVPGSRFLMPGSI